MGSTRKLATFAFGGSPSAGGLISTAAENLERHLIALRSTVIATDDECFSHDCADGMVNGYRIDEAAASAGARVLAAAHRGRRSPPRSASTVSRRLHAAGLAVLDVGEGGEPNWQWTIALARRARAATRSCRPAGRPASRSSCRWLRSHSRPSPHRRALPNTRAFCDLALKFAVTAGLDARLAAAL